MDIRDLYQPIVEAREAPLYHWVGKDKLLSILDQDMMGAYWEHQIPGQAQKYSYGNSMSRNPRGGEDYLMVLRGLGYDNKGFGIIGIGDNKAECVKSLYDDLRENMLVVVGLINDDD